MTKARSHIKKIYPNSKNTVKPVLLKFRNGKLATSNEETGRYCAAVHKRHKAAVVEVGRNIYHGVLDQELRDDLTDLYICVKSRSTNDVRIIPIDQVLLNNQIYKEQEKTNAKVMSKEESGKTLLKQFGGRRANRYVHNAEKMEINIDAVKDELDKTVSEASVVPTSNNDTIFLQNYDRLKPKCNKEAQNLCDVYNVEDIITKDLLDRLEEEAHTVYSTKIENLPIDSEYLTDCIRKLQSTAPSPKSLLHIKLIIYMDGLSNMMKTRTRLFQKVKMSSITEKVENYIREHFCDPNSAKTRLRTSFSVEKGLCHFIILAVLISEKYEIDINVLTKELCMPKAKITKFASIVSIKKKPRSDYLSLCLPKDVTAPQPRTKKGKK